MDGHACRNTTLKAFPSKQTEDHIIRDCSRIGNEKQQIPRKSTDQGNRQAIYAQEEKECFYW
ncbi:hypothetical protein OIU79_009920 [Salix purpurea]|uniref:Uncharacterized protein n=1 Tax=Salix purpurea TaxID=77065 RepID=A0A9Q0QEH6_SALPP|nr:hypothetical protein OIU79_009920 [Salix purpurea]